MSLYAQTMSLETQITALAKTAAMGQTTLKEYQWQEEEIVMVKDKVQRRQLFEVRLDRDGRIRRTMVDLPDENWEPTGENRGMREWVEEKKKHALITYSTDLKQLGETYAQLNIESLHQAYKRGDLTAKSVPGHDEKTTFLIKNYLKVGDSTTLTFDSQTNALINIQASSYAANPKEPVSIVVDFSEFSAGAVHSNLIKITAIKKHLSVWLRNSSYQRLTSTMDR